MLAFIFLIMFIGGAFLCALRGHRSDLAAGWGGAAIGIGGVATIIWLIVFLVTLAEQSDVDVFTGAQVYVEFSERAQSEESLIGLEPVGGNLKKWYMDIVYVNEVIQWHNLCNGSFWLDWYVPDWEAPDLITF